MSGVVFKGFPLSDTRPLSQIAPGVLKVIEGIGGGWAPFGGGGCESRCDTAADSAWVAAEDIRRSFSER